MNRAACGVAAPRALRRKRLNGIDHATATDRAAAQDADHALCDPVGADGRHRRRHHLLQALLAQQRVRPGIQVKVVPPPPADAKLVEFRRVQCAVEQPEMAEGPVAKDVERNTQGHYDFLFRNTAGQDIEVAYFLTNCDCASVAACSIDGSAWEVLNEQQWSIKTSWCSRWCMRTGAGLERIWSSSPDLAEACPSDARGTETRGSSRRGTAARCAFSGTPPRRADRR